MISFIWPAMNYPRFGSPQGACPLDRTASEASGTLRSGDYLFDSGTM